MYRQMVRIRTFEDNANQLYLSAKMPGLTHMYSGEEAVAVGICEALTDDDKITSTHRGHGHCVAKGAEFKEMFCELLGKEEGIAGARAARCTSPTSPTATSAPTPSSAARWASPPARRCGRSCWATGDVTVCFFGDGATAQGLLYEVMNMAALWQLPVIYACENNGYSEYTKDRRDRRRLDHRARRGLRDRGAQVDGQDVLAVNELTQKLVARCRKGEGPFFMEL